MTCKSQLSRALRIVYSSAGAPGQSLPVSVSLPAAAAGGHSAPRTHRCGNFRPNFILSKGFWPRIVRPTFVLADDSSLTVGTYVCACLLRCAGRPAAERRGRRCVARRPGPVCKCPASPRWPQRPPPPTRKTPDGLASGTSTTHGTGDKSISACLVGLPDRLGLLAMFALVWSAERFGGVASDTPLTDPSKTPRSETPVWLGEGDSGGNSTFAPAAPRARRHCAETLRWGDCRVARKAPKVNFPQQLGKAEAEGFLKSIPNFPSVVQCRGGGLTADRQLPPT